MNYKNGIKMVKLKKANLKERIYAYLIDSTFLIILLFFIHFKEYNINIFIWILYIILLFYYLIKDSIKGISIGSKIMKIKVIDNKTNKSCNVLQSIIRNLTNLYVIDLILIDERKDKRRFGDLLSRTRVIKNK